jgi:hypothetical protein
MKKIIFILFLNVIIVQSIFAQVTSQGTNSIPPSYFTFNRIYFNYTFSTNYLTHILTLSDIYYEQRSNSKGFEFKYSTNANDLENNYAKTYTSSMKDTHKKQINSNKDELYFNWTEEGFLTFPFVKLLLNFDFKTPEDFSSYYRYILNGLTEHNFEPLEKNYSKSIDYDDIYLKPYGNYFTFNDQNRWSEFDNKSKNINQVIQVLVWNISDYYTDLWSNIDDVLQKKVIEFAGEIKKNDIVTIWEDTTNLKFNKPYLEIQLSYANYGGVNPLTINYSRSILFFNINSGEMLDKVSHEVGKRVLSPLLEKHYDKFKNKDVKLISCYEILVKFYNMKILGKEKLSYSFPKDWKEDKIMAIYKKNYKTGIDPEILLQKALK